MCKLERLVFVRFMQCFVVFDATPVYADKKECVVRQRHASLALSRSFSRKLLVWFLNSEFAANARCVRGMLTQS